MLGSVYETTWHHIPEDRNFSKTGHHTKDQCMTLVKVVNWIVF
jgi:hypothetical protein